MSNLLESFPKLNENLIEKSGYRVDEIQISYIKNNTTRYLELTSIDEKQYFLDDEFSSWTPLEDNLNINIDCTILDKNSLFDEKYGIANKNSVLGIAVNYYCKKTKKNISRKIAEIIYDKSEPEQSFNIELNFEKGELADKLGIKVLLYLDKSYENDMFANISGTILGIYTQLEIYLEGKGSLFPIKIINDNTKPLWFAEFNYIDPREDLFDENSVCLYLNNAHKDYKMLNAEGTTISSLMKEIISEFIFLFIEDIKNKESIDDILSIDYEEEQVIGNVAKFWLNYLDIKVNAFDEMLYSIKKSVDKLID